MPMISSLQNFEKSNTWLSAVFCHQCSLLCDNVSLFQLSFDHQLFQSIVLGHIIIIEAWVTLTNQNLNIKTSKPILLCERLFEPDDFDAFYHFEVLLAVYYSAMLKYYYEICVSHFQPLNFGRRRQQSKQILQKNNSFFYLIILRCFRFHLLCCSEAIYQFPSFQFWVWFKWLNELTLFQK